MSIELQWLSHGSWSLKTGDHHILLDPFLSESPTAPCQPSDLNATHILVSHGHFDHVADVAPIAVRCDATVIAIYEVAEWFSKNFEVRNTVGMNLGGGVEQPFGHVKMVPALHSSQLPDGSYGGNPAGFILTIEGKRLYFACDTALFTDMQLFATPQLDLAVLPIGDLFTMGPEDSVAAAKLLKAKKVAPAHYNTWPPIEQDAQAWAESIRAQTESEPLVFEPGQTVTL